MATYKILGPDNYNAQNHHILPMLGITNAKLPREGLPPREVQGVRNYRRGDRVAEAVFITVWVKPSAAGEGMRGSRPHRIVCACPGCGREMSVGRLFQHVCEK